MIKIAACSLVIAAFAVAGNFAFQEPTKKAYLVAYIDVTNPAAYAEYMKLNPAILEKFGGRFIVRNGQRVNLEGTPPDSRLVVIEFPSLSRGQEWFNSPEYQAAKKLRAGAATVNATLIEGF